MRLQELVERYGVRFKRQLGQNLLLDGNINRIMVDAAVLTPDDAVIEVGAGLGALTRQIAEAAGRVLAIEIDPAFMPCLEDQFGESPNIRLFRGDALNHDPAKLAAEYLPGAARYKMVSNLPYYVTTPMLFHFWESALPVERMVVMVQEEVAARLNAPPNGRNYGVLSLAAAYFCETDIVHHVPRTCFRPAPKVDSCIVRMRMRKEPLFPGTPKPLLMRVVRAAFAKRRKTLRNALVKSPSLGMPKDAVLAAFESTGVSPERRAQTLDLGEFAALASAIDEHARGFQHS